MLPHFTPLETIAIAQWIGTQGKLGYLIGHGSSETRHPALRPLIESRVDHLVEDSLFRVNDFLEIVDTSYRQRIAGLLHRGNNPHPP